MKSNLVADEQAREIVTNTTRAAEACTVVLFGASGDLSRRMVVPAIFRLFRRGLLPSGFRLIGYARTGMTDDEFRASVRESALRDATPGDAEAWQQFAAGLSYLSAEYTGDDLKGYARLADKLARFDLEAGAGGRRLFYLATPPSLFAPVMRHLSDHEARRARLPPGPRRLGTRDR